MRKLFVKLNENGVINYVCEKLTEDYFVEGAILIDTELDEVELLNYKLVAGELVKLTEQETPIQQPTEIEVLQEENKTLKTQIEELKATTSFHEDLIAEMAMKLYA